MKLFSHHGILGINARNLLYIKPLNEKAKIAFADDKMRTKHFLAARGVKSARLLAKISTEAELFHFDWNLLQDNFVLKPNAGFGGEGIWVIVSRENDGWRDIHGNFVSKEDMSDHIEDILEGRFSITGDADQVFFEQRLICHPDMGLLGKFGLPDIRIIVFNLVPVMAMVRVPTRESGGKANLHMGGLGLGVDLAKGEITHISQKNRIIKEHPDFPRLQGLKIPFWDEILLLATTIQQKVTLGYLAVDIVVDKDMGPALLELNARAGLSVQIANLAPLRARLDRVTGVKVGSPEKGVRMAQDLFGINTKRPGQAKHEKPVIGMRDELTLNLKHGVVNVPCRMSPTMAKNYLEESLFKKIAGEKSESRLRLNYTLADVRGKTVFYPLPMQGVAEKVILGKRVLVNFFLDVGKDIGKGEAPLRSAPSGLSTPVPVISTDLTRGFAQGRLASPLSSRAKSSVVNEADEVERSRNSQCEISPLVHHLKYLNSVEMTGKLGRDDKCHSFDHRLSELDRRLSLIARIKPLNLELEKERFFASSRYDPVFQYQDPPRHLQATRAALETMNIPTNESIEKLLEEKRQELIVKADLIAVIGDDEHFAEMAVRFTGMAPDSIQNKANVALRIFQKIPPIVPELTSEDVARKLSEALQNVGLSHWEVKEKDNLVSRSSIGKRSVLYIRSGEHFSHDDVEKLIAHEIETHVFCAENGKLQPYQIFRRGTAGYLKTQEGLAIYNQTLKVANGERMALLGFHAAELAKSLGFREVFNALSDFCSPDDAWRLTVKVKRGFTQMNHPGAFLKNALYYWGFLEIQEYLDKGGSWEDLFMGKISLEQLPLIKTIPGLVKPRFVA